MRGFTIFFIAIIALGAIIFLGLLKAPNMLANHLSKKLGVSVSIAKMDFGLSKIDVGNIEIGNPKGYSLPKALSAEKIKVSAPLTVYLKDDIVIDEIEVDNIYLGLEFDSKTSTDGNWQKILSQYQREAKLDEKEGKKMLIRKLSFNNIRTELLFHDGSSTPQKLPPISRIELTNISTEGGAATDQLMGSVLGQMVKEVFLKQNLKNMLKGILLDSPGKAIDNFLKPFDGLLNVLERDEIELSA